MRARVLMMLVVIATAAVGACAGSDVGKDRGAAGFDDPGLLHIHGLAVNPADDELYIATHTGVFRLDGSSAIRQGRLIQDTMAFTITGPDRFLGSGHPDIRNDTILEPGMRGLLGLIESTDRAVSWTGRSLAGEVDFHALASAHDQLYGADATGGRFLVSADLKNWETRSVGIELTSIGVDPADADHIVATGAIGTVDSRDGGRTWTPAAAAPFLVVLTWSSVGLFGVDPIGAVHHSTDGQVWEARGLLPAGAGVPSTAVAVDAGSGAVYIATEDSRVLKSTDGGTSWDVVLDPGVVDD